MTRFRTALVSAMVTGGLLVAGPGAALADPPRAEPAPAPPAPPSRIRSAGMLSGGVVLTFVGGLGATTGVVLLMASSFGCPDRCEDSASRSRTLGGALLGAGGAMLAAGIVLIVIGNQKVPVAPADTRPPGSPAKAPGPAAALPTWVGAPGGAGWTWRF